MAAVPSFRIARELSTVFESMPEGVVVTDAGGTVLFANQAVARMLGLSSPDAPSVQEALRRAEFFDEGRAPCSPERLPGALALQGQEPSPVELGCRLQGGGERRWFHITATPLRDEEGRLQQVVTLYRDITAQRRSARTIRYLSEASAALVSSLDEGEILQRLAQLAVPALADWCGVDLLDADGACRPVATVHVDPTRRELAERLRRRNPVRMDSPSGPGHVLRSGQPSLTPVITEELLRRVTRDPEDLRLVLELGLKASLTVPIAARGRTLGLLTLSMGESGRQLDEDDLSLAQELGNRTALALEHARLYRETQALVDELRRSNAELERFAYVASHDLNEPLRMVSSYTHLLARRYRGKLDADADEFIHFTVDGVTRMQRLIRGLLAYARISTRAGAPTSVSLQEALDRVLANLHTAAEEAQARITADPLPEVPGDEVQLEQVLQNLIGNALKFRDSRPLHIHVSAERRDGEWLFCVRDNGIGIEPQHFHRLFVLFERLHTQEEFSGTGIGLATCKRIVERHGGRIWVESKPGEGSAFFFTLPVQARAAPPGLAKPKT